MNQQFDSQEKERIIKQVLDYIRGETDDYSFVNELSLQVENTNFKEKNNRLQRENDLLQQENNHLQQERNHLQTQLDIREHSSWIILKDEIENTDVVIGRGGWGEVRVAKFRGIEVAAKFMHDVIISPYNIAVFSREMEISSKVRHPNLVQFIGATREGTPIILSELMSTSLRQQLEINVLLQSENEILNISHDVCCALNYLHLFKPHPILHRDVSSSNVLLDPSTTRGWKAKLSDYGSANLAQTISHLSVNPGSPLYSAPEAQYPDNHSPAMDVYSFGVLLMEMVLHQSPSIAVTERESQASTISWLPIKTIVSKCINRQFNFRPCIAEVINQLKEI
jgi:serine/threonine protein kinase